MKISRTWLQKYFDTELPDIESVAQALTFHSSEVEEIVGDMLDVKILPDRAGYALCHRGVAYELGASLGTPLTNDPFARDAFAQGSLSGGVSKMTISKDATMLHSSHPAISIVIEDVEKCPRFMATLVTGISVGPSPAWLKEAIESVGQRSINNVVDATNYVMLDIGQPLHAYDAAKLAKTAEGGYAIRVRGAHAGEKITTLSNESFELLEGTTLVTDAAVSGDSSFGTPLGIAGVKGGNEAAITSETNDILIEAANFDASSTRKTAQALKLFTDASLRYQNKLSPELAAYGMQDVVALILSVAGGTVVTHADAYPSPVAAFPSITVTRASINGMLGSDFSLGEMTGVLTALSLPQAVTGEDMMIMPPFYRSDLVRPEDIAEEIGRVLGYDRIDPQELPAMKEVPDQKRANGIERLKDFLIDRGYTEVSTQTFAAVGDRKVLKPMQQDMPALRTSLANGLTDALARGGQSAPRLLGPGRDVKLFEIGSIFGQDAESLSLAIGYLHTSGKHSPVVLEEIKSEVSDMLANLGHAATNFVEKTQGVIEVALDDGLLEAIGEGYTAREISLSAYVPFSPYPFALRDIAVWTPREGKEGLPTEQSEVEAVIASASMAVIGENTENTKGGVNEDLLARIDLFDRFEKDDRISYAFRLVFQSNTRTLSDAYLDPIMAEITTALQANEGWVVR